MTQKKNKQQQKGRDVKKTSSGKKGKNNHQHGKTKSKPDTAEDLDAALMKYMGRHEEKKAAVAADDLDNQLDNYFSKTDE
jgi:C-terminal duplication domain of Friend of PRMT1